MWPIWNGVCRNLEHGSGNPIGGAVMAQDIVTSLPWVWDQTVDGVLERTADQHPDRDALVFPKLKLRWSWRELDRRVDRLASSLIGLGVGQGEHVGIWSMN